jgi:hypothetical protein
MTFSCVLLLELRNKRQVKNFQQGEAYLIVTATLLLMHTVTDFLYIGQGGPAHSPGP